MLSFERYYDPKKREGIRRTAIELADYLARYSVKLTNFTLWTWLPSQCPSCDLKYTLTFEKHVNKEKVICKSCNYKFRLLKKKGYK